MRTNITMLLFIFGWLLMACVPGSKQAAPAAIIPTSVAPAPEQSCPVTLPPADPFVPPAPYPATPPGDHFWYGDEALWTALPPDGVWDYLPRNPTGYTQKLLWWREGYSWTEEPKPELQVIGHRLDDPSISFSESPATNAFAPEFGSAMLIGVDFPTPGCWQITGRYADAELTYVVQIEPGEASVPRATATTSPRPSVTSTPVVQVTPTPLTPPPPTAIPTPVTTTTLQLVGHLGGSVSAIGIQGETLYLAVGTELALLDGSALGKPSPWPTLAGQIPRLGYVVLPNLVTAVAVDGNVAYAMVEDHGLHAIDISNPAAPLDLGRLDIPPPAGSLAVAEQVAYIALDEGGVGVYDVDDPANPIELRRLEAAPGQLAIAGGYLHLPTDGGVTLWDISNPADPVEVGGYDLPGPLQAVVVRDNIAYVADTAALRLFDLSDPANSTELSFYATSVYMDAIYNMPGTGPGCQTTTLAVTGDYAYINGCDGNQIIDISNPAQPTPAGSLGNVYGSLAMAMNDYGYLLGQDGLRVFDLSQPAAPQEIAAYRTATWGIDKMVATEYHGYAVAPDGMLQIIDISNPAQPVLLDAYDLAATNPAPRLAGQGDHLYAIDGERLRVFHLSNPIEPVEVGSLPLPEMGSSGQPHSFADVAVAGDYLYAASTIRPAILWIVDISNPTAPVAISAADLLPYGAQDLAMMGHYAIINANDGLKIIDVSDPTAPVEVGSYVDEAGLIWSDLAVAGEVAYLGAMHPYDLHVIDLSDPTAPTLVGRYTPPGDGRALAVNGSFAYVLDEFRSVLKMVDLSDPANPTKVDFYDLPNPSGFNWVTVANGHIYANLGLAGLYILQPAFPVTADATLRRSYTDPELGFSLRYPAAWMLEAKTGAALNDGSGKTVLLAREGYLLTIEAQFRPDNPGGCGGILRPEEVADYWMYEVDGVELWRPKLENGLTNGYSDGALTFAGIISPAPDQNSYVCALEIDNRLFTLDYRLPFSLEAIQAGQHRADILAEMDAILQSIIWDAAGESPLPALTPTPTPPGYDATVTAPAGSPTPDEISRIKAANANQPEIVAPLLTPDGAWQAQTLVYGCVEIEPEQAMAYEQLLLTDLDTGAETVVAEQVLNCGGLGAFGLAALSWSPSSRYLYYNDARDGVPDGCGFWQPTILRWDRTTGQTERLGGGAPSPDGTKLAVWLPQERVIAVWDADGEQLGRVSAAADAFPGQIAWSPDSQRLVYLQVSSYCPPEGPTYVVSVDAATLEQTVLLEAEQLFRSVAWEQPGQLRLTDANGEAWTYNLNGEALEQVDLTAAAMETVIAFNQTDGVRETDPFIDIPPELWHPAIAALQPRRVYWHQNNLAVVLAETDATETGLYIGVPISSYVVQNDDTIQLIPKADGLYRFSKKRSD